MLNPLKIYSCIFTDIELGTDIENLSRSTSLTMTFEDNQSTYEENIPKSTMYATVLLIFMTYYIFFLFAIVIANVMSYQIFLKCL